MLNRAQRRATRATRHAEVGDHQLIRKLRIPETVLRDMEWGAAHGWDWEYHRDGSKTAIVGRVRITFPVGFPRAAR